MNKTIIKMKLFALSFLIAGHVFSQQKLTKVSQSISVDKDVTIDLNTSHCNIVFDTWNKGSIEIEAYIEGEGLSQEELKEVLKHWNVDIDGSQDMVSIRTEGHAPRVWAYSTHGGHDDEVRAVLEELKFEIADLPEMHFDYDFEMPDIPEIMVLPEFPEMPELPELPKGIGKIHFDYEAYKKDGEKYLEKYSQNIESEFGEDFQKKMEVWGEKFGKVWEEKYGEEIAKWAEKFGEEWGEKYAEKVEAWGERFGERMERQAERIAQQKERIIEQKARIQERKERMAIEKEKRAKEIKKRVKEREKLAKDRKVLIEKLVNKEANSKVKKTIKIKMPKGAKLKVNVRYGELEFAANVDNLRGNLSHTKFKAHSVNGSSTSINASYSPVYVTHWNSGELNLNYVKNAELDNVKQMVLTSNSSNVNILNLQGNAIIDGSIGDLNILKIDDSFTNLNVILQNSDAIIALPKTNHNLQYKGTRSRFSHPEKTDNQTSSFSYNSPGVGKTIVVNAKYSNVNME